MSLWQINLNKLVNKANKELKMVRMIGLFLMCLSVYCLQKFPMDLSMLQAFCIGLFLFFSEALLGHFFFIPHEETRT